MQYLKYYLSTFKCLISTIFCVFIATDFCAIKLNALRYFDDFKKKIPRAEIEAVEQVVKTHFATFDPELQVTFCGSYRRGKLESGDMDVLVSKSSYISTCNKKEGAQLLHTFIQQLEALGLVTDTISLGDSKFMVMGDFEYFCFLC